MRSSRRTGPTSSLCVLLLLTLLIPASVAGCRRQAGTPRESQQRSPKDAALPATASPTEVVKAFLAACRAGDYERALALSYAPTELDREHLRSGVEFAAATERLRKAVAEHFGPAAEYELDFGMPRDVEFDDAVERIASGGEEATVVMAAYKDVPPSDEDTVGVIRLVRRDGRWLVGGRPRGEGVDQLPNTITLNRMFARSADLTVPEVKAGKYAEPSDVAGAFRSRPFNDIEPFRDLLPPELSEELREAEEP